MPLIQINMLEGRTTEQKRALLVAVTRAVQESIGAPLESIRVWISDLSADQLISAGVIAADRQGSRTDAPEAGPGGYTDRSATGTSDL